MTCEQEHYIQKFKNTSLSMDDVLDRLKVQKKLLHPDETGSVVVGPVRPYCRNHIILDKIEVKSPSDCWRWLGNKTVAGYGKISLKGERLIYSHRMVFSLLMGPIPEGLEIRHKCDNPICCNPFHLEVGTHHDNMMDKIVRGRANVPHGENHCCSKLTAKQIPTIRAMREDGLPYSKIAKEFSVGLTTIRSVVSGHTWRHIQ